MENISVNSRILKALLKKRGAVFLMTHCYSFTHPLNKNSLTGKWGCIFLTRNPGNTILSQICFKLFLRVRFTMHQQ